MALKRAFFMLFRVSLNLLAVRLGLSALGLLGQEDGLDVGEDSALGNCHPGQQLVQLLVVPDRQLEVPRDDPGLLVVPRSISSELEDLGGQVLHDGGHVDWGTSSNPLGIVAFPGEQRILILLPRLILFPDFDLYLFLLIIHGITLTDTLP